LTYAAAVLLSAPRPPLFWQIALIGCAALLCSGCFKATFVSQLRPGSGARSAAGAAPAPRSESFWQHQYVYGLLGSAELDLRDVCPSGAAQIETGGDVLTTAVSLLSVGIYTPRTLVVRCQGAAVDAGSTPSAAERRSARPVALSGGAQ